MGELEGWRREREGRRGVERVQGVVRKTQDLNGTSALDTRGCAVKPKRGVRYVMTS